MHEMALQLKSTRPARSGLSASKCWMAAEHMRHAGEGEGTANCFRNHWDLAFALLAVHNKSQVREDARFTFKRSAAVSALPHSWIFHRDCIFDRSRLQALLQLLVPRTLRLKGVLRVASATWVAVSAAPGAAPTAREQDAPAPSSEAASSSQPPPPAAAAAAAAPVELSEIAYRRDSRVEMIIDVAAAAACSTQAADRDASLAAGALEQQAAQLGLDDGGSLELRVAAALSQAAAGDWDSMEALLLQTMAS